jgi:hypothetical protein
MANRVGDTAVPAGVPTEHLSRGRTWSAVALDPNRNRALILWMNELLMGSFIAKEIGVNNGRFLAHSLAQNNERKRLSELGHFRLIRPVLPASSCPLRPPKRT